MTNDKMTDVERVKRVLAFELRRPQMAGEEFNLQTMAVNVLAALTGGVTQIDSAGKPYDPANMVSPLPCKCGWQWSVTNYPHDVCGQCSGEYVVICPRCKESGPLKAQPWWAVNAWNDQRTAAIGGVTQADVGVAEKAARHLDEAKLQLVTVITDDCVKDTALNRAEEAIDEALAMLRASQAGGGE